jgi:hypothetical protein
LLWVLVLVLVLEMLWREEMVVGRMVESEWEWGWVVSR